MTLKGADKYSKWVVGIHPNKLESLCMPVWCFILNVQ